MKIAKGIEDRFEEFVLAESKDQGKPVSVARSIDIPRAIYNFKMFSSAILHQVEHATHQIKPGFNQLNYTHKSPVGVSVLISPWNLPLYLLTWKIAPCIAFGNTCVCKPSEQSSLTASLLCEVLQDDIFRSPKSVFKIYHC